MNKLSGLFVDTEMLRKLPDRLLLRKIIQTEISACGGYLASNVLKAVFRICKKLEVQSLVELLNAFQLTPLPARYYPEANTHDRK